MLNAHTSNQQVLYKLRLAAPLMPAIFIILAFIGILSPLSWSVSGMITRVLLIAAGISIVAAYCIASFVVDVETL